MKLPKTLKEQNSNEQGTIIKFYNSVAVCAVAIRRTSERNKNIEKMNLMKENSRLKKMGKVLNCGVLRNARISYFI